VSAVTHQINIFADAKGVIQHIEGVPAGLGFATDIRVGQHWWELFAKAEDQAIVQRRFLNLEPIQRIQSFSLESPEDKRIDVEIIRLSTNVGERSNYVVTIVESSLAIDRGQCEVTSIISAPYAEERFRLAIKAAQQVTWIYDIPSGKLELQNENECILGFEFGEIIQSDSFWWERVHPEDLEGLKETMDSCLSGNADEWECEHRFLDKEGSYRWVRENGKVVKRGEDGRCLEMIGITTLGDVSGRQKAYEALKRNEQLLSEMSRIAKIGGWSYDVKADKLEWTEEVHRIVEVDLDYVPNVEDAIKRFPPDGIEKIDKALAQAIEVGEPYFLDLPFITEKGNWRWGRTTGFAEVENGETTRVFGVFQDITETDRVKRDLEAFFVTAADMLAISDFDGHFIEMSNSWQEILGYSKEEIQSAPFMEFVHPADRDVTRETFAQALEGKSIRNFENRYKRKDGQYIWMSWTSMTDLESKQIRAAARDVTDIKSLNEKLNAALIDSNAAVEAKNQFLAVMSHELRTPLNPIMGYAALIERKAEDETHRRMAKAIQESGDRLLSLIEDILNLSSIESGLYRSKKDKIVLSEFTKEIETNYRSLAEEKGIQLLLEIISDESLSMIIDAKLLRNAIFNLLGNAIKFTQSGSVKLRLVATTDHSTGNIEFSVEDSGIGMSQSELEHIFSPFTQGDTSDTRNFDGVGLGLSICHKAIELLNGDIKVESQIGSGTRFFGNIPFLPHLSSSKTNAIEPELRIDERTKVLIVDDDSANRTLLREILSTYGLDPSEVNDGENALNAIQSKPFDLIFMDIHLPGMNGIDATRRIRSNEEIAQPYIVAVTADLINSGRKRCIDQGMDDHLSKPISEDKLNRVLTEFLKAKS